MVVTSSRKEAVRYKLCFDKYIAENALVIPLLQYVQPILHAPGVVVTPHASGSLLPHLMKRA
jgi:peptide/nickel transport system substrate-binding protein